MHQALYRKWRPQRFEDVYGQDHITSILKYEIENSKFSHAYLFCGSRGTGKTTCAKILAKAVNCLDVQNGSPCGKCEACRSIDSGSATDVLEMDAASNNGVDDIRDIREEVVYSPSKLKYRVYIIDEVHMLSQSAFNALLKTLEEPPEHVVFILATTELHKLPATIVSRCQRFDFRRISTPILKEHLLRIATSEGIEIDEDAATALAKHAQGGMRDAISLLDLCAGGHRRIDAALVEDTVGSSGRGAIMDVIRAIAEKDYEAIFSFIDTIVQSSKDITVFWQELISVYRDLLVVKTSKNSAAYLDLTDVELEGLRALASMFTVERLSYHCDMMREAYSSMYRANAVRRIVAELTLVRMCDERLNTSPEAMLSRIAALESGAVVTVAQKADKQDEDIAPVQPEKPQKKVTEAPKRKPVVKNEDDDMFRGDAPAVKADKPIAEVKTPQKSESAVLRPFKQRSEITERMDHNVALRMVSSYCKMAKWYLDSSDRIVLRFTDGNAIVMIKQFGGDRALADAATAVLGRQVGINDVVLECVKDTGKRDDMDDLIDNI